jgi:hypothetical protein
MGHIEKYFSDKDIDKIKQMAVQCRGDVLKMTTLASSGHPGGSMSSMEMYLAVYHFANESLEKRAGPGCHQPWAYFSRCLFCSGQDGLL